MSNVVTTLVTLHQKDSLQWRKLLQKHRMHPLQLIEYEYFTTTVQNIYKFDNCTSDNMLVWCLTIRQCVWLTPVSCNWECSLSTSSKNNYLYASCNKTTKPRPHYIKLCQNDFLRMLSRWYICLQIYTFLCVLNWPSWLSISSSTAKTALHSWYTLSYTQLSYQICLLHQIFCTKCIMPDKV